jgi:hypothetical protein
MDKEVLNPKHEIRNSKQIQMTETKDFRLDVLEIRSFEFWICFGLVRVGRFARYSNFEF